jgi:glycosyltransferase involved in cell wall biosynthesis
MELPVVSVLMTAYNREKYIAEAIESVLASTLKNFELIIVDDTSKDDTIAIARKYEADDKRIRVYVNEQNLGDYNNRNKAAEYATGKYIKYLDSDDIMYPHCLEVMVTAMEKFPEAGFGLSAMGDPAKPYPALLTSREAYVEHFHGYGHFDRAPGSSIIKKDVFEKAGRFSGEKMIGDNELWYRLALHYPMVKFGPDLYWSRSHEGQESQSSYARQHYDQLRKMVMDRYFDNPDCPLSDGEKKLFRAKISKGKRRSVFVKAVKTILPVRMIRKR